MDMCFYFVFIIYGLYFSACNGYSLACFITILVRNKVEMFISGKWSSLIGRKWTMRPNSSTFFIDSWLKTMCSAARLPSPESLPHYCLVVWTWTSYIITFCFCFLIGKIGVVEPTSVGLLWGVNELTYVKFLKQCLVHSKCYYFTLGLNECFKLSSLFCFHLWKWDPKRK